MAPEVLNSDSNQTNKIDIYSSSLMLWEMWFGLDLADEMNVAFLSPGFNGNAMDALKNNVGRKGGWRPSLSSAKRPPDAIISIMQKGWDFDQSVRHTATEIVRLLESFLANN